MSDEKPPTESGVAAEMRALGHKFDAFAVEVRASLQTVAADHDTLKERVIRLEAKVEAGDDKHVEDIKKVHGRMSKMLVKTDRVVVQNNDQMSILERLEPLIKRWAKWIAVAAAIGSALGHYIQSCR